MLTPAFHFAVLERYSGIFVRRATAFANKLCLEEASGSSFDFMPHIGSFVTDTVMETAFGLQDIGDQVRDAADRKDFIRAADNAFQVWPVYSLFFKTPVHFNEREFSRP